MHDHPRIRELLPRASETCSGGPSIEWLSNDLDTLCRVAAVLLGLWEECWPEGESAPRLRPSHGEVWLLDAGGRRLLFHPTRGFPARFGKPPCAAVPALAGLTHQCDALAAIKAIVAHLLEAEDA